jgi:hypothetical protein
VSEYRLENWSVYCGDPYQPPELGGIRLHGTRVGEDSPVVTNYVDHVEGRRVTTLTGSVYVLGEPDPQYLRWMAENGHAYDPEQPIRVRRGRRG